jgi:hypothetical protein
MKKVEFISLLSNIKHGMFPIISLDIDWDREFDLGKFTITLGILGSEIVLYLNIRKGE